MLEFLGSIGGATIALSAAVIIIPIAGYWLFNKYVFPSIDTAEEKEIAMQIADAMDEITDNICKNYPGSKWAKAFDKLVDKIKARIAKAKIK